MNAFLVEIYPKVSRTEECSSCLEPVCEEPLASYLVLRESISADEVRDNFIRTSTFPWTKYGFSVDCVELPEGYIPADVSIN